MKRLMFATVGTGEDSVSSLVQVVREYNPDHVVFLTTELGRREVVPEIVDRLDLVSAPASSSDEESAWTYSAPQPEGFEHPMNAERLCLAYRRVLSEELIDRGAAVENAVADFSEGTRPMSAALFEAAVSVGIPVISYVTGERDEKGEVIPGTERNEAVHGRRLRAAETLREAIDLFNTQNYGVAVELASELAETPEVYLPHGGRARYLLRVAARVFQAWDRFQLREALETMQKLGDEDQIEQAFVAEHLMGKDERESVRQRHLHHALDREMYFGLLADVFANARRRAKTGAWDDAVARLYRGLEYVAQLRIWEEYGHATAEVPVDALPDPMRAERSGDEVCSLGLVAAWRFLREHGDALGAMFERHLEEKQLEEAIRKRNASILAHGFEPIGREYADLLREAVDELARRGWGDEQWERSLEACAFPKIEGFRF